MASQDPPRRRHSPAVYRRRRLVVVLALLAVIALIWVLIAQPWRGSAAEGEPDAGPAVSATPDDETASELPVPEAETPTPSATPSATPTPRASASASPDPSATPAVEACAADELQVEAVTDKDTYGAKEKPQLSIRLTNLAEQDCTLNVGTTTQVFTVTSGDDTWWRSTDCQTTPSDQIVLLAAGQSVSSAQPIVWDRTRSSVKSCQDDSRPKAPGGGASYHLSVEIGGVTSEDTKQFLLY